MAPADRSAAHAMGTDSTTAQPSDHIVRLRLGVPARVDLGRAADAFGPEARWLGELVADGSAANERCRSRFLCDLELQAGGNGPTLFRKAALVCFGTPTRTGDGWTVPVEWRAATLAPLFPVFAGNLRLTAERIELSGSYAPPGGALGSFLDSTLLGAAARGTGRWFLRRVAQAVG